MDVRNQLRISQEDAECGRNVFVTIPDNPFDFLARKGNKKKVPRHCLGISSKINVQYRAAVVLALELKYQHQLLIARRLLEEETGDPVAQ